MWMVARKNERAVDGKLFNKVTKRRLCGVGVQIVRFVQDHNLSITTTYNCHSGSKFTNLHTKSINVALFGGIDNDVVNTQFFAYCSCHRSLAATSFPGENHIRNHARIDNALEGGLQVRW